MSEGRWDWARRDPSGMGRLERAEGASAACHWEAGGQGARGFRWALASMDQEGMAQLREEEEGSNDD